jgi:N-methylhydantoinase B
MIANVSNTPAEVLESEFPLAVTQYGFVPDTGGLGEFRGGLAMRRCIRVLADEAVTQVRSDRRDVPPYGLNGGHSGTSSAVWINRAKGDEELPPAKFITTLHKGDEICFQLASGGGYGTPLNRACEHVLHDVLEGKSSIANAQDAYGVVIAGKPPQVDIAATRKLRIAMRKAQSPAV